MPTNVVFSVHEDWMVNVLLSTGEVFAFNTEMWPEHGTGTDADWPAVTREAENKALFLSAQRAEPFCRADVLRTDLLWRAINQASLQMSDYDFRRLVRR